jgi:hypothetical protein
MCYNTGHEANADFIGSPHRARGGGDSNCRFYESRACEYQGCVLDLPQLLDRVARTPLQGGLQEMRLLFELF